MSFNVNKKNKTKKLEEKASINILKEQNKHQKKLSYVMMTDKVDRPVYIQSYLLLSIYAYVYR